MCFLGCRGIERIFKALRRMEKSGENDVVTLARLFEAATKAGRHCFSNIAQESVTADDWAAVHGAGSYQGIRETISRMSLDRCNLAGSNFRLDLRHPRLPRPSSECKTCGASAHSLQVAFEECLLAVNLDEHGKILDTRPITHSWACGLVKTVGATATHLEEPAVIAHIPSGQAFLAILNANRVIFGWPLRVLSLEHCIMTLICPIRAEQLEPLIIMNACLGIN